MTTYIHLNLKRFDVLNQLGGVNHQENVKEWGSDLLMKIQPLLAEIKENQDVEFVVYLPEAHLIPALNQQVADSPIEIGCQSVYRKDIRAGENFGAFTTNRPAASMKQLGVTQTIIGHFEERVDKNELLAAAGVTDFSSTNQILNQEIKMAQSQGMKVLYCVGESATEKSNWQEVLKEQVIVGLDGVDESQVVIAYEPIWAIGPGKTPPSAVEIKEISDYLKKLKPQIPAIYGGGLKQENAQEIAGIDSIDGGLIALTRFSGNIGFYPEEYIEIIKQYFSEK